NSSLSLGQFIGLAINPTDPSLSYGGTQDNGTQKRLQSSVEWFEFLPGDGGRTVINPKKSSQIIANYCEGKNFRFNDGGQFYDRQIAYNDTFGEPFSGPRMSFYPPFTGNGVDATLYFGTWRLFVSGDTGESWSAPAGETDLTKGITEKGR